MRRAPSKKDKQRRLVLAIARGACKATGARFPDALGDTLEGDLIRFRVLRVLRVTHSHLSAPARDELIREYLTP